MKIIIILFLLASNLFHSNSYLEDSSIQIEETSIQSTDGPILFVIKVPVNADNLEQINKLKGMEADGVFISQKDDFLFLQYKGEQLTSDVNPEFIKEISVIKGEKAKQAYPNAPENGVIEMLVEDANTLIQVFYAIKAS